DRTADLLHAMQALSQLSYTPKQARNNSLRVAWLANQPDDRRADRLGPGRGSAPGATGRMRTIGCRRSGYRRSGADVVVTGQGPGESNPPLRPDHRPTTVGERGRPRGRRCLMPVWSPPPRPGAAYGRIREGCVGTG